MIEVVPKDILKIVINLSHISMKTEKSMSMLMRQKIKKEPNQTSRDKNLNVWKEKLIKWD